MSRKVFDYPCCFCKEVEYCYNFLHGEYVCCCGATVFTTEEIEDLLYRRKKNNDLFNSLKEIVRGNYEA